jgi:hypothetical protein
MGGGGMSADKSRKAEELLQSLADDAQRIAEKYGVAVKGKKAKASLIIPASKTRGKRTIMERESKDIPQS